PPVPGAGSGYEKAQINKRNAERGYGTTLYAWDGDTLALERDSQSQTDYLYAPGSFTPMVQSKQSPDHPKPELAWYQCDHLGTPMELTDAQGKTIWEADYGAFGRARVDAGSTTSNHIRFPGQYHDEETGLHYNRYRYYEPETGRYLSKDPIGLEGGINKFGYVSGSPLLIIDPLGLVEGVDQWYGYESDKEFQDWWHKNKKSPWFESSEPGFNKKKPYDIPNKECADRVKEYYDWQKSEEEAERKRRQSNGPRPERMRGEKKPKHPSTNDLLRGGRGGGRGVRGLE
ncbi:RHS repeat domain-containing protein, partial [Comamonas composti]|uniref:RHS repeat domain-containing protein n=1 Tax=Comamonas composti TaxID=408558 RepID=UPI001B7FAA08